MSSFREYLKHLALAWDKCVQKKLQISTQRVSAGYGTMYSVAPSHLGSTAIDLLGKERDEIAPHC